MAERERLICDSSALAERGLGVRFQVEFRGRPTPAFALRFQGVVRGYLNRCAHVPMELDWRAGEFFDSDKRVLLCSTHGAAYDPSHGRCLGGPCDGTGLRALRMREHEGKVYCAGVSDG